MIGIKSRNIEFKSKFQKTYNHNKSSWKKKISIIVYIIQLLGWSFKEFKYEQGFRSTKEEK